MVARRRQRGAVAVFAAVAIIAMLTAMMLAIEVGRVYSAHRELQKAATLAALDATRVVSGCSATPTQANLDNAVTTSLAFNGYTAGRLTSTLTEFGTVQTNAGNLRTLQPTASINAANAARVTLTAPFPTPLIPLLPTTGTSMRVSATASQSALGSLRIGGGVAALNGGVLNSLLSALTGGSASLSLIDYNGLAGVNVTASQLATALGVSVTDLSDPLKLQTTTPVLSSALNGLAGSLSGTASKQVTDSLQNLAGISTNNTPIPLGNILGPVGNIASDVPFVNLQDLVMALALASQADSTGVKSIELKNIGLDVPGVAIVKVFAKVLQPPQLSGLGRPGQTKASTAQIKLLVRIDAGSVVSGIVTNVNNLATGVLSLIGSVVGVTITPTAAPPPINLGVDIDLAPATAYLNRLDCPKSGVNNGQPVAGLNVDTALAAVKVGTFAGSASTAPALDASKTAWSVVTVNIDASHAGVNLLGTCLLLCTNLGTANLQVGLSLTSTDVSKTSRNLNDVYQFTLIPTTVSKATPVYRANGAPGIPAVPVASPTTENPQTVGASTNVGLTLGVTTTSTGTGLTGGLSGFVGSLINSIISGPTSLVQRLSTMVNGLATSLINPLLNLLGVQLGTATTTMDFATVGQPYIVNTTLP